MKIENILNTIPYDGIKTKKLVSNNTGDVILIAIEKGSELSAHKASTDASVLILEGEVIFKIAGEEHTLKVNDLFSFEKDQIHAIEAVTNTKLVLIK